MSFEQGRFIGIGVAHVDYVFDGVDEVFPTKRDEVLSFIETHKPYLIRAGGPMPNTFTVISQLPINRDVRLFYCIGDDERGRFFQEETTRLIGAPQIHPTEPTGVWVGFNDERGFLKFGIADYGASLKVYVSNAELVEQRNDIFMTDVSSCKNEEIHAQTEKCLKRLDQDGGIFVLSLGGARPASVDTNKLSSVLSALRYDPQIVFSNTEEFKYTTGAEDLRRSIFHYFPNTRLLVITAGAEGSLIRFEDQVIEVPATTDVDVKDDAGAGDAYAGTMLGQLFNYPYKLWDSTLVKHAGYVASFAASQVIASPYARLSLGQTETILNYSTKISYL